MNIKKVDDKPMVIHTKKKATLHIVKKKSKDKPKHKIKLTGPWKWQKNVYEGMSRNIEGMIKRFDNLSMEVRSRDAGRSVEAEAVDTVEMDYEEIEISEPGDSVIKVAEEDKYEVVVRNGKGR